MLIAAQKAKKAAAKVQAAEAAAAKAKPGNDEEQVLQ